MIAITIKSNFIVVTAFIPCVRFGSARFASTHPSRSGSPDGCGESHCVNERSQAKILCASGFHNRFSFASSSATDERG
jgi:hypothetical protein